MVEEVYKNIYRIGVELPGNPLRETNAYYIPGEDRDLLIDTGFRRKECREALEEGLRVLGSDPARRSVLCTHLHADHSGMADLFCGGAKLREDAPDAVRAASAEGAETAESGRAAAAETRAGARSLFLRPDSPRIYMGRIDMQYQHDLRNPAHRAVKRDRFLKEGFPKDILDCVYSLNPAFVQALPDGIAARDPRFTPLEDGAEIRAGAYTLKTLVVPGHTPGNCMFWLEKEKVMFTGDHILFDITPNITEWKGVEDSLGSYMESLLRVRNFPVETSLPGHRAPGDYHERIGTILAHHERRLNNTLQIIAENPGLTGYDIAGLMKWKIRARNWQEFPATQKWFAVGECYAHLDYLRLRGKIRREEGSDGMYRYYVKGGL